MADSIRTDHLVTGTVNASTRESVTADEIATWIRGEDASLPRARVALATFFLEVPLATQIAFLEHHGIDEAKALAFAERNEPLDRPLPLQSRKRS